MGRCPRFPLIFCEVPSHPHPALAIHSDVAQDDEGWMWLPAEPAVVAPELARNSPFRSKECSSFLQSKSKAQVFWAVKFLLAPETWGRNVSLALNYPMKALPTSADISASLHVDIVCQEMPFESMSHTYLLGVRFQTLDYLNFWSTGKKLWKTFHVLKNINDLHMLETNVILIILL